MQIHSGETRLFTKKIDGTGITAVARNDELVLQLDGEHIYKRGDKLCMFLNRALCNAGFDAVHFKNIRKADPALHFTAILKQKNSTESSQTVTPHTTADEIKPLLDQLEKLSEETQLYSEEKVGFDRALKTMERDFEEAPKERVPTPDEVSRRPKLRFGSIQLSNMVEDGLTKTKLFSKEEIRDIGEEIVAAIDEAERTHGNIKAPLQVLGKEFRQAMRNGLEDGLDEAGRKITAAQEAEIMKTLYAEIRKEVRDIEGNFPQ